MLLTIFFILGAIVASFVGVVVARLNTGHSFIGGRSLCDAECIKYGIIANMKKEILPKTKRLFWDMDAQVLDVDAHAETIIERVLNDGTLADWRWLVATYGSTKIRDVLGEKHSFGRDNIRRQSRRLVNLILK